MKDYSEAFRRFLTEEKQASKNTVESYMRDASGFLSFCTDLIHIDPCVADSEILNRYLGHLQSVGKSEATCARAVASVRCFYRYLMREGEVLHNPADAVRTKKTEHALPDVLTADEVMLLLAQPAGNDYKSIRDKAMLELLYATGIKVSELIELTVSDINPQVGILHTKNNRSERIIPMYPGAVRAVMEYLVHVRPAIVLESDSDRLFTNMNGRPLSRQGFWKIVKHYSETAGIKKDITPHTLRHSFAAHLLENGAELKDIKEMLGHSDISSTQVYAKFIKSKYTQSYAKFHPLAK